MNKFNSTFFAVIIFISTHVTASSGDAWKLHHKEVVAACKKNSELTQVKVGSDIMGFSDEVGVDALVISGRYPQPHMNNTKTTMLCLFNKKTKTTAFSEMSGLHKKR